MYDGTLGTKGPWQALVTFQQMIILADREGIVDMTAEALARRSTIPLEIIQTGLAALESPDSDSRSPDLEGRRIVRLSDTRSWGWVIVNYEKYRAIRSLDDRREYMRNYQRERRQHMSTPVNTSKHTSTVVSAVNRSSRQYAVSSKQVNPTSDAPRKRRAVRAREGDSVFTEAWTLWLSGPLKRPNNSRAAAERQWLARVAEGDDPAQLLEGTRRYAAYVEREKTAARFIKIAATFYGRDRHYAESFESAGDAATDDDQAAFKHLCMRVEARRQKPDGDLWWDRIQQHVGRKPLKDIYRYAAEHVDA